jgi:hypothetical protein
MNTTELLAFVRGNEAKGRLFGGGWQWICSWLFTIAGRGESCSLLELSNRWAGVELLTGGSCRHR